MALVNVLMALVRFVVGAILGAATMGGLEILMFQAIYGDDYRPSGIGWFVAPAVVALAFGRGFASENFRRPFNVWALASFLWFAAVGLYYWYVPHDRSGETLLTIAAAGYLPVVLSLIGLLIYRSASRSRSS
jgi:hypothetical protein